MKHLWWKFVAVFLGWMGFSMLISVFATTISVSTNFDEATQYLKKIVVMDNAWNNTIELQNWEVNAYKINADRFCSPNWCANIKNDVLDKFTAMESMVETESIRFNEHNPYNYIEAWDSCTVDNEWMLIYAYDDANSNNWYLWLCKRTRNSPSPHFERRKLNIN